MISRIISVSVVLGTIYLNSLWAEELKVDLEQSTIRVEVKATGDDFVASLTRFDARIEVQDAQAVPRSATVTWDFKDLKTGKKSRDKEMLQWLEHTRFPTAQFTLKNCQQHEGKWTVTGELKMHGVSKSLSFPLEIKRDGSRTVYKADLTLDHRDFGLERIVKFLVLKVDPLLAIHFELSAVPQRS
ncbi:MAG TPA: YceI family protein [Verrucomicrobiae bacterium]